MMTARPDRRQGRAPISDPAPSICADPLWALTVILGDIADRVERHRAAEHVLQTPETRRAAGSDPAPPGEVA